MRAEVLSLAPAGQPGTEAVRRADIGVMAVPICGLKYQTLLATGLTNERGEFRFGPAEAVTFLVGGLVLGTVRVEHGLHALQSGRNIPLPNMRVTSQ